MTGDGKRAMEASSELEDSKRARGLERGVEEMAPAAPASADHAYDHEEEAPIVMLPDELLVKILRISANEVSAPACACGFDFLSSSSDRTGTNS
eukprot:tig00021721_g23224.t1